MSMMCLLEKRRRNFRENWALAGAIGIRTALATPLLREGVAIGAILIRRLEVSSLLEKQIALLKTFADQAVIAIENVRLFKNYRSATATSPRPWSSRLQRERF